MLTHRNLAWASHAYAAEVDSVAPGDAILHAAPMSHGSGVYIMQHVARLGVQVVPESGGFEPEEIFALFNAWPRVSMFAAPTMIKRLVACPADCDAGNIRTLIWGGAPMYVEDALAALDRFGPRLAQIYGQGEAPMTITTLSKEDIAARDHPRWRERLGSAGKPYACVEVMVADGEDNPVAQGETGEILVRGDVIMAGYWRDEKASASALRNGWLHTGDVGAFDAEGYLQLKDRSKDLIISGGSNVYPREVEEVLLTHGAVREVSVIGRPDREWGEAVVAYVVGEASAAELDALCLSRIARFKRPKDYVFVDALAEEQLRQDPEDGAARDGCEESRRAMNEIDRKTTAARCPICGKPTDRAFSPFCSKRCADIDLNRWLSGVYAVPVKEDEDEDGERPPDVGEDERS